MEIHPELRQAIKKDELIIFVGAGLSFNLINTKGEKLGGWTDLVDKILDYLIAETYDFQHLKPLVRRYDPIKILDLLEAEKNFPKREVTAFTKAYFDIDKTANDFSLHTSLFKLSKKIITTNYDTAFEYAEETLSKNKAHKGKNYELTTHKDPNSPLLFKLHGCHESVDSMVLFSTDYKNLYENKKEEAEHPIWVLKNIIFNKNILFVGTGMGDYQINTIFEEIKRIQGSYNQRHFIISKNQPDSKLSFLTHIPIKDFGEIKVIIDSLLKVKDEVSKQKSPETERLEKELADALDRQRKLENDRSSETKRKESRALKYFIEGLERQLQKDFEKAIEKYEIAIDVYPEFADAYFNWGNSLLELARLRADAGLYEESFEKYKEAVRLNPEYASTYMNWGNSLAELAKLQSDAGLYEESFEKYKETLKLNPEYANVYYNWGNSLSGLANLRSDAGLYEESFEKYKEALRLNPEYAAAYMNWGNSLSGLAKLRADAGLYEESFEKYKVALKLNPESADAYNNWGNSLLELARLRADAGLYGESIEKYKEALKLNPEYANVYYNWGALLFELARLRADAGLYEESFEKYKETLKLNPEDADAYSNWGTSLAELAKLQADAGLYEESFEKYKEALKLNPESTATYSNWGTSLAELARLRADAGLFEESIEKYKETIKLNPEDADAYSNWGTSLTELAKLQSDAGLYEESIEKYKVALKLNPESADAYNNWGTSLLELAKFRADAGLFQESIDLLEKIVALGGHPYNLACVYALTENKEQALRYLELSLNKNQIKADYVKNDSDWNSFKTDVAFLDLLEKYPK